MTDEQLAALEREAAEALMEWLGEQRLRNDEGMVMIWTDGKPVAADVLNAVRVLRRPMSA